ncbi:MAG: choice-of-anchor J domain-containing protein [Saprospiraceae bacterium]|nr:choice-of-anchor J domain-containing protein [Saprospiraceae bacterium]
MTRLLLICALSMAVHAAQAQARLAPDTLLVQRFEVDPTDTMLPFPFGDDLQWVNWDADRIPPLCDGGRVLGSWYWDSDLGDTTGMNSAFTSCSYLANKNLPNENWLITPPIFITDTQAILTWRSLSLEGPGYHDGYKVLVSTTSNAPYERAFTDTLFVAAEMLGDPLFFSLDPKDFTFSLGYVHANWYRDSAYFFLPTDSFPFNRGRMEPHSVSLSAYIGKKIYIAFLHDSQNDNTLQIDDIVVVQGVVVSTLEPLLNAVVLRVQPNPVRDIARLIFPEILRPERLQITDLVGRVVAVQMLHGQPTDSIFADLGALPSGVYVATLWADCPVQSARFIKY